MRQQRRGSCLHIHADAGHAAFHHAGERVLQLGLFEIMLILPHADGLRIDLHQFGKRVLHAPRVETALRAETSYSGNSFAACLEAE